MSDEQDQNEGGAADAAGRSASGESAESGSDSSASKSSASAGAVRPSGKPKQDAGGSGAGTSAIKIVKPKVQRGASVESRASRNPFARLLTFIREVVGEMRKVIWPTKNEMVTYTIVVLVFIVGVVGLTTGLDVGFGKAVTVIFG